MEKVFKGFCIVLFMKSTLGFGNLDDKLLESMNLKFGDIFPILGYLLYTKRTGEVLNFSRWDENRFKRLTNFNAAEKRRYFLGVYNLALICGVYEFYNSFI